MHAARLPAALALVSAALLAYELLLMRLLALAWSGQFAGFTISVAMLGLAAAGIALHLARERVRVQPARTMAWSAFAFALLAPACFAASQQLPFAPFMLLISAREVGTLALRVLLFALPFAAAGLAIGVPFVARAGTMHALYACNMAGSAIGAVPLLVGLSWLHPAELLVPVSATALMAAALTRLRVRWLAAGAAVLIASALLPFRYSEYKPLARTLQLPEAGVLREVPGADALQQLVESPRTRWLPGLSLNHLEPLPPARLLFADGDAMEVLFDPAASRAAPAFLRAMPEQFAWTLRQRPHALLLHAGAPDLLRAQLGEAQSVLGIDRPAGRVQLLREWLSGTGFEIEADEGRHFLAGHAGRFGLIQLSLLGAGGEQGLAALPLFTREGFDALWSRLGEDGLLAVAAWIENPPRSGTRLAAWIADGLRRNGVVEPQRHVLALRGWSTLAVVVGRRPFGAREVSALQHFVEPLSFDAVYFPGITAADVNRRNRIPGEPYHEAFERLLAGPGEDYVVRAPWQLSVPTDDRPFFGHWFRLGALPELMRAHGRELLAYADVAYLLQWSALIVAAVLGIVLLLPPCLVAAAAPAPRWLLLFLVLGLGYMAVELWAIHRLRLFLAHDALATAVTLGVMLSASGLGALVLGNGNRARRWPLLALLPVLGLVLLSPALVMRLAFEATLPWRVLVAALWLLPAALLMGVPFPAALARIEQDAVPWALAANGFGSVLGALAANLVALDLGLRVLGVCALLAYLAAAGLLISSHARSIRLRDTG